MGAGNKMKGYLYNIDEKSGDWMVDFYKRSHSDYMESGKTGDDYSDHLGLIPIFRTIAEKMESAGEIKTNHL